MGRTPRVPGRVPTSDPSSVVTFRAIGAGDGGDGALSRRNRDLPCVAFVRGPCRALSVALDRFRSDDQPLLIRDSW
jgi:hypothetical protein